MTAPPRRTRVVRFAAERDFFALLAVVDRVGFLRVPATGGSWRFPQIPKALGPWTTYLDTFYHKSAIGSPLTWLWVGRQPPSRSSKNPERGTGRPWRGAARAALG